MKKTKNQSKSAPKKRPATAEAEAPAPPDMPCDLPSGEAPEDAPLGGEPAPDAPPDAGPAAETEADPLQILADERDELNERLLRLRADFDNFRKRSIRERDELMHRASENLMEDLIPILDHFSLGFEVAEQHEANPTVVEGFRLVYDQALNTLGKHGLVPLDVVGKPFDPHRQEAISHLSSEEHPADTVIAQTRRGYLLGDRLLRAAQVVVSSGCASAADAGFAEAPSPEPPGDDP
jgi:molecular chaperone GrpE